MSKNEFDELLLKKLRDEELEYNPAHWDRLAQLLPPTLTPASVNKGKKWTIAAGIAAALALALATVFFVKLMDQPDTEDAAQPALVQQQESKNAVEPGNTQPTPAQQPALAHAPQKTLQTVPATASNGQQVALQHTATSNPGLHNPALNQNPVPNNKTVLPDVLVPAAQPKEMIADNKVIKEQVPVVPEILPEPGNAAKNNTAVKQEPAPTYAYNNNGYSGASAFYEGKHPDKGSSKKTSISLGGGVNYGNLNTGYTAGISVRRKVAGDLFVDGSVAMLYNNNASNVAINNGPPLADNMNNTGAKPTAFNNETNLASPALDPIQKLYYVQFNPSIGYQVEKHVALSVGGDFQQILNKRGEQDEIVQPGSNSAKVFPNFDVGLTAKSEFSITPNIQAGLVYREGLNNILKTDGAKYVNRRYIQVQFKYNLPVN